MLLLLSYGSFDCKKLNINHGHVHCGKLYRQRGLLAGLNAELVDKAGNLYACLFGEVRDKTVVYYLPPILYGVSVIMEFIMPDAYS